MCDSKPVTFWLVFRQLLSILAIVSLALTPVAASTVAGGVAMTDALGLAATDAAPSTMAGMGMDEMPCCPPQQPIMPDCQKDCPLAALCLGNVTLIMPASVGEPVRVAVAESVVWGREAAFHSVVRPPPAEPPRS